MPRGKRPRKAKRNSKSSLSADIDGEECNDVKSNIFVENLKRDYAVSVTKLDKLLESQLETLKNKCDLILYKIPPGIGNQPFRYLKGSDNILPTAKRSRRECRSRSHSPKFTVPKVPEIRTRVSRSCSRATKNISKGNAFITPSGKGIPATYNMVTPKINPNVPLMMMRRPRQGEVAISLSGSPLLVSSVIHEPSVNINIPMKNGSVMSILPEPGLQPRDLPESLDRQTREQLQTIFDNLKNIITQD